MTIAAPPTDLAPRVASTDPADFPVPTGREEAWRFAPMDALRPFFDPAPSAGRVLGESSSTLVANVPTSERASAWLPTDRPGAIALACASNTVRIDIPADAVIEEPVIVHLRGDAPMAYQHVEVRAGRFSRSTVVLEIDTEVDRSGAIVTELADGADLTLLVVVDGVPLHTLIVDCPTTVGRDARYTGCAVVLGGATVRLQPSVHYAGSGGSAELLGAFLAGTGQFIEQRIFVEHEEPHCSSRVVYKGALTGADAHSVWIGDVLVRRSAIGTDTYEINRNLLLDDGPRADSVPNLELETGDVTSAGHASATGRFDDEQLFYLMARGITEERARQLVVRGFFADVVSRVPAWRDSLMRRIAERLGLELDDE